MVPTSVWQICVFVRKDDRVDVAFRVPASGVPSPGSGQDLRNWP